MTDLNTALESVAARFVTRVIVPVLLAGNLVAGAFWANLIHDTQIEQGATVIRLQILQGQTDVRVTELERRLNSRGGPISDRRSLYSVGLP